MDTVSTNTIIVALMALTEEIRRRVEAPVEIGVDLSEEAQLVLDMQAAVSELSALYEEARAKRPDELPPLADWLSGEEEE